MKKRSKAARTGQIQVRLKKMLEENLEGIGGGLVQKAIEGNYNAAQLLLRLGVADPGQGTGETEEEDRKQARMFFLEMVEQVLGERAEENRSEVGKIARS
jgi:hypothetical protein